MTNDPILRVHERIDGHERRLSGVEATVSIVRQQQQEQARQQHDDMVRIEMRMGQHMKDTQLMIDDKLQPIADSIGKIAARNDKADGGIAVGRFVGMLLVGLSGAAVAALGIFIGVMK